MSETEEWVWVPFEVDKAFDGLRVDRFLARRLTSYSRGRVQTILKSARVMRGDRLIRASAKVRTGDKIRVAYLRKPEVPLAADAQLPVLFEDDDLLIINKPAGLLSHPTDKVVQHTVTGILRHSRAGQPFHLLHRLDRETSGVLALAKNPKTAKAWTRAMEQQAIQKKYLALVRGCPNPAQGVITWPIGRQGGDINVRQWINTPTAVPATTQYRLQSFFRPGTTEQRSGSLYQVQPSDVEGFSAVWAFPKTGRLHQVRVHLAALGHPLLGDPLYQNDGDMYRQMITGKLTDEGRETLGFPRVALHAAALEFVHPSTLKEMRVEAELPEDFREWLSENKILYGAEGAVQKAFHFS